MNNPYSFNIFANSLMRMSDFIKYNRNENPVTVTFNKATDATTIPAKFFVIRPVQLTNSISDEIDTVLNQTLEEPGFLPSLRDTKTGYFKEIKQNEINLPVNVRNNLDNDWLTIVLLLAFVLLVSVRAGFQKYIGNLFHSVVNYSTSFRMFNEKNYSFLQGALRLEVLYYIVFSVFIYQVQLFQHVVNANRGLILFGKTVGFIVLYYLLKKLIYWFIGIVFNSNQETSEFLFNLDNYNRAASIVLFPVVALIAYYPSGNPRFIVFLGIIAVGFFYIMILRRGALILLRKQFSIFYLFLYLCSLEFLPLLLIYKIVVE